MSISTITLPEERNSEANHFRKESAMPSPDPVGVIADKQNLVHDTVSDIDNDPELGFTLRGYGYNPLIDGALPLFGLVIRLRRMGQCGDVERLYNDLRDRVAALDEENRQHDYDSATLLAFRYALCSFIDEAVMSTDWGSQSLWTRQSLLSYYHNETWGGEKFFTILSRMMMEPTRYRHVLEFKYLCLCLGFRGKYGIQHDQVASLNGIIAKLHDMLRKLPGPAPEQLTDAQNHIASRSYRLARQWPVWTPWGAALALNILIYFILATNLGNKADIVLQALDMTLKH